MAVAPRRNVTDEADSEKQKYSTLTEVHNATDALEGLAPATSRYMRLMGNHGDQTFPYMLCLIPSLLDQKMYMM